MRARPLITSTSVVTLGALLTTGPALPQQIIGTLGLTETTATIEDNQFPPAPPKFEPSGNLSLISHLAIRPTATAKAATAFNTRLLGQRGPLPLRGILRLIRQSAKLESEVNLVLTALAETVDDVTCTGDQFPGQWNNLAGVTVAPYACDFSDKWLLIDATVTVTGPDERIYDSTTPAAVKNADVVVQRNPVWIWRAKK